MTVRISFPPKRDYESEYPTLVKTQIITATSQEVDVDWGLVIFVGLFIVGMVLVVLLFS